MMRYNWKGLIKWIYKLAFLEFINRIREAMPIEKTDVIKVRRIITKVKEYEIQLQSALHTFVTAFSLFMSLTYFSISRAIYDSYGYPNPVVFYTLGIMFILISAYYLFKVRGKLLVRVDRCQDVILYLTDHRLLKHRKNTIRWALG